MAVVQRPGQQLTTIANDSINQIIYSGEISIIAGEGATVPNDIILKGDDKQFLENNQQLS